MKRLLFALTVILGVSVRINAQDNKGSFRNTSLPVEARVNDLLKQLTLEEKISLLGNQSKAVTRLGIPAYNWWNEALHGVARAGNATVFPQAIGMAASFNDALLNECATAISAQKKVNTCNIWA